MQSVESFNHSFVVFDHPLRLLEDGRFESALKTIAVRLYSPSFGLTFLLGLLRLTDYSLEVFFKCFEVTELLLGLCCDVLVWFGLNVVGLFRTGAFRICDAVFGLYFRVFLVLWFIDILMD